MQSLASKELSQLDHSLRPVEFGFRRDDKSALSLPTPIQPLQDFSTLDALYKVRFPAFCEIISDDKAFSPKVPAEALTRTRQADVIWALILNPTRSLSQIAARQHVIQALLRHPERELLGSLFDDVHQILFGVSKLCAQIEERGGYPQAAILSYSAWIRGKAARLRDQDDGSTRNNFCPAEAIVLEGFSAVERGLAALPKLVDQLARNDSELLRAYGAELQKVFGELPSFTRQYCIENPFEVTSRESRVRLCDQQLTKLEAFLGIAELVQSGDLNFCSFESDKPVQYTGGWTISCRKSKTAPNKSPRDTNSVWYCGGIMSGKSERGLKQEFFINLLAQSTGCSSVAQGNFRIYSAYCYFDRIASDHENDLSAYGNEIKRIVDSLPALHEPIFGCFDETGSTTSPVGQRQLCGGLKGYFAARVARIRAATHNEEVIEAVNRDPDAAVYHFAHELAANGVPKFTYVLTEGIADSNSLAVAKALKFNAQIIERAEAFLAGTLERPESTPEKPWSEPEALTEAERDILKKEQNEGCGLIPYIDETNRSFGLERLANQRDEFLMLYSHDDQIAKSYLHLSVPRDLTIPTEIELGGWQRRFTGDDFLLTRFVRDTPTLSPSEKNERRRTFAHLIEADPYDRLRGLSAELNLLIKFLPYIFKESGDLLRFNQILNPCAGDLESAGHTSFADIQKYLRMNHALLGKNSRLGATLRLLDEIIELNQDCDAYQQTVDISAYGTEVVVKQQYEDAVTVKPKKLLSNFKIAYPEENNPERWHGRLTHARVTAACDNLRRAHGELDAKLYLGKIKKALLKREKQQHPTRAQRLEYIAIHRGLKAVSAELRSIALRLRKLSKIETYISWITKQLAVTDPALAQRIARMQRRSGAKPNATPSPHALWEAQHKLKLFVIGTRFQRIPPLKIFEVDLKSAEATIRAMTEYTRKYYQKHDLEYHGSWPTPLVIAILLDQMLVPHNSIAEFVGILRTGDSVHLQQGANRIGPLFYKLATGEAIDPVAELYGSPRATKQLWKKHCDEVALLCSPEEHAAASVALKAKDEGPAEKLLKLRDLDDPRKLLAWMKSIFCNSVAETYSKYLLILEKKAELDRRYHWARASGLERPEATKLLVVKEQNYDDLYRAYRTYDRQSPASAPRIDVPEEHQSGFDYKGAFQKFFREQIRSSKFYAEVVEYNQVLSGLLVELRTLASEAEITLDDQSFVSPFEQFGREIREKFQESVENVFPSVHWGQDRLLHEIRSVLTLAQLARYLKVNGCEASINTTGEVRIAGLMNMFHSGEQIPNDVELTPETRAKILRSPNMSGKTFYKKELVIALACAEATGGYLPARSASIPYFEKVVFFDRVIGKDQHNLSSAGNELARWDRALNETAGRDHVLWAIDEAYSTMSQKYQGAFSAGTWAELVMRHAYVLFSTHHHSAADRIQRILPEIGSLHFAYTISEKGEISFQRTATDSPAESEALRVARMLGMPEEILAIAERS